MTYSILVGTPNAAFGELIRISLEENPTYRVRLVHHSGQVLATMERIPVDLVILDADLPGPPFIDVAGGLVERFKRLKMMVIPPDNNPAHPAIHGLIPHSYLYKPFYLPDLLETVERLLGEDKERPAAQAGAPVQPAIQSQPPTRKTVPELTSAWIDSSDVEQKIAELLPGSAVLESLVLQNGKLWVYAGKLSEKEVRELEGLFGRLLREGTGALIRFARLGTGHDYLLFAASLIGDLHLVLVFPGNYPLSRMRSQAISFKSSLLDIFQVEALDKTLQKIPVSPGLEYPPGGIALTGDKVEGGEEAEAISLDDLLGEIPSPDPGSVDEKKTGSEEWDLERATSTIGMTKDYPDSASQNEAGGNGTEITSWDAMVIDELDRQQLDTMVSSIEDTQPIYPKKEPTPSKDPQNLMKTSSPLDQPPPKKTPPFIEDWESPKTQENKSSKSQDGLEQKEGPGSDNIPFDWIDTEDVWAELVPVKHEPTLDQPTQEGLSADSIQASDFPGILELKQIKDLETAYPAYSSLAYTFILIPKIETVLLVGDLASRLNRWVAQLCLAYGWRLDQVQVRPKYLQWTVRVLPYGSPGNIASIMRLQLSSLVLKYRNDLEALLPSGDFWAPGYLVLSGPQQASIHLVEELIADIRRRQGLTGDDPLSDKIEES